MRTRRAFWKPLALLVATLAVAAACGNDDGGVEAGGPDGGGLAQMAASLSPQLIAEAATATTADVTSGRFTMTVRLEGEGLPDFPEGVTEVTFSGEGAFNTEIPAFSLRFDFGDLFRQLASEDPEMAAFAELFGDGTMEVIQVGDTAWAKFGFFAIFTGDPDKYVEAPADELDTGDLTAQLGVGGGDDPSELLSTLEAVGTVEAVGEEEVRGVATLHVRGTLDPAKLAAMDGGSLGDLDVDVTSLPPDALTYDLWLDGNRIVRRFRMTVDLSAVDDPDVQGVTGTLEVEVELFDLGEPVDIQPPPADQVVQLDPATMGGLFGGPSGS